MADNQQPGSAHEYLDDAWQRSILFLNVLRKRGNRFLEQQAKEAPNVLQFDAEAILDGRTFARPVNYILAAIKPLHGVPMDPRKRPFVVVDPRAGHGPGIGGMKQDSEIGVALDDGHPCYFIGFLPEPQADQTIEDVWNTEAEFVRTVARRHPEADKPAVIGNCQAGWQTMIMAATHRDIPGPLLLAGAPLSYWAGERGKNPMRYLGGMLGGSWLTHLGSDLGGGKFDGANLVANFESLDPANTYFEKPYNVYSKVDTEAERFLDFETWWGSPVVMNGREIQWIVDNLFIGNRLTSGELRTSGGLEIDLRNIQSPIVVFCSKGDNITSPQQALGWITDLYRTDDELIANGQTIVYSVHESVGHLGIFVSGKVATREHDQFVSAMDMIDFMPPGLYEAVLDDAGADTANRDLVHGNYVFRLERRKLDDIRAIGGTTPEDELKFRTVDRVSAINRRLYETTAQPWVKSIATPGFGEWARKMHPNRLRFALFSDQNPAMRWVATAAESASTDRRQSPEENIFAAGEKMMASTISSTLKAFGSARDALTEQAFHLIYGNPILQTLVGLDPKQAQDRRPAREALREQRQAAKLKELETRFDQGGAVEAALRSIAFIRKAEGSTDERSFAVIKQIHDAQPPGRPRTMAELKIIVRDQSLLLHLDEERAIKALPKLLPRDQEDRVRTLRAVQRVVSASGDLTSEGKRRLARIELLFGIKGPVATRTAAAPAAAKESSDASA